jgi:hypothetical protein
LFSDGSNLQHLLGAATTVFNSNTNLEMKQLILANFWNFSESNQPKAALYFPTLDLSRYLAMKFNVTH